MVLRLMLAAQFVVRGSSFKRTSEQHSEVRGDYRALAGETFHD